jgi:hypothetical protein
MEYQVSDVVVYMALLLSRASEADESFIVQDELHCPGM